MKKPLLNICAALMLCLSVSAQTTVTVTATGTAGSFNTGSVNSAGVKNDGNMININQTTNAGWAKFNLTSMPAGAVVISANCVFTTYSTTASSALNNLYGFVGDPAVIAGATLYSNCNSGTTFNNSTWTANATNTQTLNASGVSFIQTNIASPQLCIGYSRGSTNNYNIYGYPGTTGQQPMLVITYSVSTPCSGTPNAGTALASSTLVCSGGVVNLNLTGSTAASGLSYQWQSSPNGSSWTSIPTASTIATTETVTAATYYQCIVACATNTAVSTSIFVNLTSPPFAGTISGPSNVNTGTTNVYTITPTTGNIQWYSGSSSTGPWGSIVGATSASNQTITAVGSGTVYYTVIASTSGCVSDTANVPYPVIINFIGDNVCDAIPLTIGASTVQYGLLGATTQTGEVVPPGTGCSTNNTWCNNTLNNSRWFSFVAPASGYVTVQSPGFDTQLAVWKAATCTDLLSAATATLIAANDDDMDYVSNGGIQYSSFLRAACLTPGTTYFIQLDSYSPAISTDITTVIITDMGTALNASFTGLAANYCLPGASNSTLTPVVSGGIFTVNSSTTSVTSFSPSTIGTNTVTYSIYGCITNSTTVVANTPTVMAMSSNTVVCAGSTATLTASGASNYTWTSGGTSMTEVVTPTAPTTYTVTGEDNGCISSNVVSVGVNALPSVTAITSSPLICYNLGESAILTASTSATSYTWSDGANTMTTTVTPTVGTTYTLTVNDGTCDASTTVFVDAQVCNGITTIATSANGISVYPNPTNGILNISISSALGGITSIEVYDAIGRLTIKENLTSNTTTINTSKLEDGIYVFKIINNNKAIKIGKIVKQ